MNYHIRIRPRVQDDIDEARSWYDSREPGLGQEFSNQVDEAIDKLAENPLINAVRVPRERARYYKLGAFRTSLFIELPAAEVVVGAVIHSARHQRVWKGRFDDEQS